MSVLIHYLRTQRHEGELGKLEALHAEGDTDDGDAEQESGEDEQSRHLDAAEEQPDDVDQGLTETVCIFDVLTEREQRQTGELEALDPDGDPDYRYAVDKAPEAVSER